MKKRFEKSLKLFEDIYFPFGELETYNYFVGDDNIQYWLKAKDKTINYGESEIFGRSVFCPRIVCRKAKPADLVFNKEKKRFVGDRFFLTLDPQGCYDSDFSYFWDVNRQNIKEREIDVTDMSKEEIMQEVEKILNMSNQQIMDRFDIKDVGSANIKIELLLDDLIYDYFASKQQEFISGEYGTRWGMRTIFNNGSVQQQRHVLKKTDYSEILINPEGENPFTNEDYIKYKVLNPEENETEKIKIIIEEVNVNSELGKKILQMLQYRFVEKHIEEGQNPKEQNEMAGDNSTTHATLLAVCMEEKSKDLEAAGRHIVEKQRRNGETLDSVKS